MGALWTAQAVALSSSPALADATAAPAPIEAAARNETLHVIVGLMMIALLLSLWALWQERRMRAGQPASCRS